MHRYPMLLTTLALSASVAVESAFAQLPPSEDQAQAAIDRSPRHGEWVRIDSRRAPIKSWVMFPERGDRAPVIIVIHSGATLNDWTRAIADRLAADGYIAIAPDLDVEPQFHVLVLDAVREYALKIPAANGKVAALGFEQSGYTTFQYALSRPALNAAVVFSGAFPPHLDNSHVGRAPILALYGGNTSGANHTIAEASEQLRRLEVPFEHEVYEGASYDFLSARSAGRADEGAAQKAWARMLDFLRRHLQ